MAQLVKPDLASIKLLVLDVDGVLTDGTVMVNHDGRESSSFSTLDGHGIRLWKRAGLKIAFLSGRYSEAVEHRAKRVGADYVFQECHYKLPVLKDLLDQAKISADQVACIGDDLPDLPMIRYVGFGAAVAGAVDEVKQYADYITTRPGGNGAVREVIELILKSGGKWEELMKRYLQ